MPTLSCWQCQASLAALPQPISRHATCDGCGYEVHCCRQCGHYAPTAPSACQEDRADVPNNKEVANFCEYFSPVTPTGGLPGDPQSDQPDKAAAAKAKLDALFGGGD